MTEATTSFKMAYLAGAMEAANDSGSVWRDNMEDMLMKLFGIPSYNPCKQEPKLIGLTEHDYYQFKNWKTSDLPRLQQVIRKIIDYDIQKLLNETAFVICKVDEACRVSTGTAAEITLAYHHGIPVYLVLDIPIERVSAWMLGCATHVFNDNLELLNYLTETKVKPEAMEPTPKLGLDIHGVITRNPWFFSRLTKALVRDGFEVHIQTGAKIDDRLHQKLKFFDVAYTHLFSITNHNIEKGEGVTWADENNPWFDEEVWNRTKGNYCHENGVHLHLDDSPDYGKHFRTPYFRLDLPEEYL